MENHAKKWPNSIETIHLFSGDFGLGSPVIHINENSQTTVYLDTYRS